MDRVDGTSVWQLREDNKPVPGTVFNNISEAVGILHEEGIVFGDLRDSNILLLASKDRAMLVDFDWSGMDRVSRYPATLNPSNAWPEDVSPYSIMRRPMIHGNWIAWPISVNARLR